MILVDIDQFQEWTEPEGRSPLKLVDIHQDHPTEVLYLT